MKMRVKKNPTVIGQPCPRCGRMVLTRDHWYNIHTRKGRQRAKDYQQSEKGKAAAVRYYDRLFRRQAQAEEEPEPDSV